MTNYSSNVGRPVIMGTNGMVSSGNALASQAALRVLQDGGNAIDAAVTAAWTLAVVRPAGCGIGGDFFMLAYDAATEKLTSMNGSGRAPQASSLEEYRGGIPSTGPRSVTVPGAVRGWTDALAAHGTISLADSMAPAIKYASDGFPVSVRLSKELANRAPRLRESKAAAAAYLKDGQPYQPGELLRLPDLANSLRMISEAGPDVFYRGELAEAIARGLREEGGLLTVEDLARQDTVVSDPLAITYRGYQIYNQRPVSMGMLLLQQLKLVEGFDLAALPWDSAERAHVLIEATKLSFADLAAYITDPDAMQVPAEGLLSDKYVSARRALIDPNSAADGYQAGDPAQFGKHTTYLCVVDGKGNAVSWIQTLFAGFGSCWVAPGTGILLTNRLTGFSTDPNHINRIEGGKRTVHTLNAPMVLKDGKPVLVFGTPGALAQTQSNLQMATNFIDYGMDVQLMVEAPRWKVLDGRRVQIETRFPQETLEVLSRMGHELELAGPMHEETGGAEAIRINQENGVLEGAADPRREGYAVGW